MIDKYNPLLMKSQADLLQARLRMYALELPLH